MIVTKMISYICYIVHTVQEFFSDFFPVHNLYKIKKKMLYLMLILYKFKYIQLTELKASKACGN